MVGSASHSSFLFEHDLFGKPVPTFPDHALVTRRIGRNRRRLIGGNGDCRSRLQLELTNGHHTKAQLESGKNFRASVDPVAGPNEGANGSQAGLAVIRWLLGDKENGVAVKRIIDRR